MSHYRADIAQASKRATERLAAMSPEERAAHWEAQRRSFLRGMTTPCEHGELDFEQCIHCRHRMKP